MFCSQDFLEGSVTINASPRREAKSLMTGYPLSFLLEGILVNLQIKAGWRWHTVRSEHKLSPELSKKYSTSTRVSLRVPEDREAPPEPKFKGLVSDHLVLRGPLKCRHIQ